MPAAAQRQRRSGAAVAFDEVLDRDGIRVEHREALRQTFEVFESRRTLGVAAERLPDRFRKLDRQRGLQAYQRHAFLAVFEPDFEAVGGMGIDDLVALAIDAADGCKTVLMRARSRHEAEARHAAEKRRSGEVERAVAVELPPQAPHQLRI